MRDARAAEAGAASSMRMTEDALRKTGDWKSKVSEDWSFADKTAAKSQQASGQAHVADEEARDAMNTAREVQDQERAESRLYEEFEQKIRSVGLGIENMQQQKDAGDSMEAQIN